MLSADSVEQALSGAGIQLPPCLGSLRRNLVVRGFAECSSAYNLQPTSPFFPFFPPSLPSLPFPRPLVLSNTSDCPSRMHERTRMRTAGISAQQLLAACGSQIALGCDIR